MTSERPTRRSASAFSRREWFFAIALLGLTFAAYWPAWNGGPVWDDEGHLTKPHLRSLQGLADIWTQFGSTQQYYPLTHTLFWIEHRLWGDTPIFYHLVSILLHAIAALLLVKVLKRLQIPGAWFAGAIFALHPVQVESVAWISELKNTLSAVFFFLSALTYVSFDRARAASLYFIALALFLLGLFSKTTIAVLPVVILVVLWWQRGRLSWKRDLLPLIPFFAIGIGAGLVTAWVERNFIGAEGQVFDLSPIQRILVAGRAFWFYLWKLFWPANLTFIYPRWDLSPTLWWQYLFPLGTIVVLVTLWLLRRRWRGPLAGFLSFIALLFPALGFFNVFPFLYSFVADHFQYLACIGIIALAAGAFAQLVEAAPHRYRWLGVACGFITIIGLAALTWQQAHAYQNEETLWRVTIARNPACWMAYNNLGKVLLRGGRAEEAVNAYAKGLAQRPPDLDRAHYNLAAALVGAGKIDGAIEHYRTALQIRPDYADAHYNLGGAFVRAGRLQEAIQEYTETLRIRPDDSAAHNNLGSVLLEKGRAQEAISHFLSAAQRDGQNADIQYNLAHAFARSGELDKAIAHYQTALEIQPDKLPARYELANTFLERGNTERAMSLYQEILATQPEHAGALSNLGNIFLQTGHPDKAIYQYERTLAINPQNLAAETNLAWVLATCSDRSLRNGDRALELARRANELAGGKDPVVLRSLAAAYAETGQFVSAVQTAEEALKLATESGDARLIRTLSKDKELYRASTPYRKDS